jgi:hypothetical protein
VSLETGPLTIAGVRALLAGRPHLLTLFNTVHEQVAVPDTAVLIGGSVARGEIDDFSDLDVVVVTESAGAAARHRDGLRAALKARHEVLACFDAAHLGLACLDSIFAVVAGQVTKLDATFWSLAEGPLPVGGELIHDGPGLAARLAFTGEHDTGEHDTGELSRAPVDIVGWTFHVGNLLRRGEFFEAAYCLDQMRRRMLVPVLLCLAGLPQVNYRRIETRLPAPWLDRLRETYPAGLQRKELRRSLRTLADVFATAYQQLPAAQQAVAPAAVADSLKLMLGATAG